MKARTRTTRWLLISLLLGLLAAAGLTLTFQHGVAAPAAANGAAAPAHAALQPLHETLNASTGGPHTLTQGIHWVVASSYSDSHTPAVTDGRPDPHTDTAAASNTGWSSHPADQADDTSGAPQPQSHPATGGTSHVSQAGSGDFAYQTYAPLGCEMPAGCGAVGASGYVPPQTSGTSGGLSAVRTAQPSGNNDQSPPPNDGGPQTNDSGQNPPAVAAPELDAATLAGAVTLLLGALAILRGRRPARATR